MKNTISKLTIITTIMTSTIINAQNFYTCLPKESWVVDVVKREQEAERRRIEEAERKRREEEERKRREEEERRKQREICLEKQKKCNEKNRKIDDCFSLCGGYRSGEASTGETAEEWCRRRCGFPSHCGTCN